MASRNEEYDDVAGLGVRLANIRTKDGFTLGMKTDDGVLDISATALRLGLPAPKDMDDLLQRGLGRYVRQVIEGSSQQRHSAVFVDSANVQFAPLVTRPEKIICIGFNYRQHAKETATPIPEEPPLFSKFSNALNHHNGTVNLPTHIDDHFDFETELVIVFGRECKDIAEADALDYVAGYAVGNDLSARTLQTATSQFLAGKASDGFAPVGPWLVTRDRVADPNNLRLQTHVNGKKRQDWNTNDMIFDCKRLIAFVASIMTIKPGDILFTGTPQGVILGEKAPPDQRRWLQPGDEVVSDIEGLGQLRVQLSGPQIKTKPKPTDEIPRKSLTVDRLAVLTGGEAHVTDISQWSPGVNEGKPMLFSNNVYLIKHGNDWLLWDTGLQDDLIAIPDGKVVVHGVRGVVKKTVASQLQDLGVKPEEISHIAFSHAHFDHIGNSRYFSKAKWYVQQAEFDAMFGPDYAQYGFIPDLYKTMRDNLVVVTGDEYDVFGDGSVTIFSTPGHTPGHQSLLVRLADRGPVMLSGDMAHFWDNFCCRRVPHMNVSEKQTKESMDRVDAIVRAEGAELWINHDWEQNQKIPHAPEWIL
ncbi:hypothetical protein MMC28_006135 [Mycoblastus sanguinarius]|nr:hypothetical protein [Mycoblastus sanguinarius]